MPQLNGCGIIANCFKFVFLYQNCMLLERLFKINIQVGL